MLEETWNEAQGHTVFLQQMIADVKLGKMFMLYPRPQVVDLMGTIHVFGVCAACGEPLESAAVVGIFMLECRHQYHPLCFIALLQSRDHCVKLGCTMVIPKEAKSWITGLHAVKSKCFFCKPYANLHGMQGCF